MTIGLGWAEWEERLKKLRKFPFFLKQSRVMINIVRAFRFYNGGLREKDILTNAYLKLIRHVNSIYKVPIPLFALTPTRLTFLL